MEIESMPDSQTLLPTSSEKNGLADPSEMVWISGGMFWMGSDRHYPEEAPEHQVRVDGFWIDRSPVSNRDFEQFVEKTHYVTFAEIPPNRRAIQVRYRRCFTQGRRCLSSLRNE